MPENSNSRLQVPAPWLFTLSSRGTTAVLTRDVEFFDASDQLVWKILWQMPPYCLARLQKARQLVLQKMIYDTKEEGRLLFEKPVRAKPGEVVKCLK
jgi:hypothetical protein